MDLVLFEVYHGKFRKHPPQIIDVNPINCNSKTACLKSLFVFVFADTPTEIQFGEELKLVNIYYLRMSQRKRLKNEN